MAAQEQDDVALWLEITGYHDPEKRAEVFGAHRALREFEERVEMRRRVREEERAREEKEIEDERKELLSRMEGVRGLSMPVKRGYEGGAQEEMDREPGRKVSRLDEDVRHVVDEDPQPAREASTGVRETPLLNGVSTAQNRRTLAQGEAPAQVTAQNFDAPREAVAINRIELARPADPLGEYYTAAQMREEPGLFVTPARSVSSGPRGLVVSDSESPAQFPLSSLLTAPLVRICAQSRGIC